MKIIVKSIGTDLFMGVLRIDIRLESGDEAEDFCYFFNYGNEKKYPSCELQRMVEICKEQAVDAFFDDEVVITDEPGETTATGDATETVENPTATGDTVAVPANIPAPVPAAAEPTTTKVEFVLFDKTQQNHADKVREMIAAKLGAEWRKDPASVKKVNAFILESNGKKLFWNTSTKVVCPEFLASFEASMA